MNNSNNLIKILILIFFILKHLIHVYKLAPSLLFKFFQVYPNAVFS